MRDSEWLAQLLECGLLRGSLVPPAAIRDLRELTRYRKRQIEDRAQEVNRLHRVLEDAGLKLASVMTDVMGVSGRAMIDRAVAGPDRPGGAGRVGARTRLRRKLPALQQALAGQFRPHHAFLVTQILAKIDFLEEAIAELTEEIDQHLRPFEPTVTRLMTIPGLARRNAITLFVETGGDMPHFPTRGASVQLGGDVSRASTKARGNGARGKPATAIAISGAPSSKPASPPPARAAPRCRPATIASNAIAATRRRWSPSAIRSSKSRST